MVHPKNPSSLGYMQTCEHLYSNMFHGQNIVHNVGLPYQSENPQQGLGGEEPPVFLGAEFTMVVVAHLCHDDTNVPSKWLLDVGQYVYI